MRHVFVFALAALVLATPATAGRKPKPATHSGTLVARTTASVTVKRGDRTVTCSRASSSPKVSRARVGRKVKIACTNGILVGFKTVLSGSAAGTISALSASSITVHTDGGDVTCALDDRSPRLGDYHVGDKVKIACTEGTLTAIAKLDAPADVQTGLGILTALSDSSLTVHTENHDLTCSLNDHSPRLGEFHVGDKVKIACTDGVLTTIARVTVTTITTGVLSALSPASATVLSDGGERTCSRTNESPSLDGYHVGDRVKMICTNGVLTAIARADVITDGVGVLTALSADSLTVHTDGGDKTCSRTNDSPSLDGYHIGDRVKIYCTNGVLTAIARADLTSYFTGTLSALSSTSLTVHTDGGEKTCSRTNDSPSLDGYQVGNSVKATCVNGVLTAIQHL
jgi:hypothetical protein